MSVKVTVDGIEYSLTKLENGNILVEHANIQYNPMHGPDTEGVHAFEVHPCQKALFAFWNRQIPESEQTEGKGRDGAEPWWSLRASRTDTATRTLADQHGRKKTSKKGGKKRSPKPPPGDPDPAEGPI